jgi:hypothetical protein
MTAIDVKDSVEINCSPETVFNVISDYNNQNKWFPVYRCVIRGADKIYEGAIVEHIYGKPPFILGRFTRKVNKIVYGSCLEESYIEEVNGKTRASFLCKVNGNTLSTKLMFKVMGNNAHSNTYVKLLVALKNYCENL